MAPSECSNCDSKEVAWFIKNRPFCKACAYDKYEITDAEGHEVGLEESLGDQALMAVEDELTITLGPPPTPEEVNEHVRKRRQERECPGTMGGTHNVVSLATEPDKYFCKGCGKKIVCTCSYDESEEMTRHAPLCALVKAGVARW